MPQNQWKLEGDYKPWYLGWENGCDERARDILKQYYETPKFLPKSSDSDGKQFIFMGTSGYGAFFHQDTLMHPTWQAQVTQPFEVYESHK